MTSVGIRDFRNGLSRHLEAVRAGATVTITDHGRPVARVVPVGVPTRLEQLIADGVVTPPARAVRYSPIPVTVSGSVSDLVADIR